MMMGGMRRMGAGRTARVTAVSFTALLAATTEVPTARPTSSTTTIPSLSSWFRIRIAFRVLAVAAEREREQHWHLTYGLVHVLAPPLTYSRERDEALHNHLCPRGPGASPLEEGIQGYCYGTGSSNSCYIAFHKTSSWNRLWREK